MYQIPTIGGLLPRIQGGSPHDDAIMQATPGVCSTTLEDPLVDAIHGEFFRRFVAGGAALAEDSCVRQGVGSGRHIVVAALAGSRDRRRSEEHTSELQSLRHLV